MKKLGSPVFANLSDKVPQSAEKTSYSVYDISIGISEILNERFRGLAIVNTDIKECGYIIISEEYTTYLLKLILKAVFGRFLLPINISFDGETMILDMPFETDLDIPLRERADICVAAVNADFEIDIRSNGIKLSAKAAKSERAMSVYAGSMHSFKDALYYMFFDK